MTQSHVKVEDGNQTHASIVKISRLDWLAKLRWFGAATLAMIGLVLWTGEAYYSASWLWGLAGATALINVALVMQLGRYRRKLQSETEHKIEGITQAVIVFDLFVWLAAMHFAGGMMNPLVAVLVLLIAIAASLLKASTSARVSLGACLIFAAFTLAELFCDMPAPASPFIVAPLAGISKAGVLLFAAIVIAVFVLTQYFTNAILLRLRGINQRLIEANRELAGIDLLKSRFLRISSHQLRGPLAAIHTMTTAVSEVGGLTEPQYEIMVKIRKRLDEVMAQMDEMMLLSTIKEKAHETTQAAPVDVKNIVEQVTEEFFQEAALKKITLTKTVVGDTIVSAWPDAIETVLEHLLSNAIKYTPQGGSVSVTAKRVTRSESPGVRENGLAKSSRVEIEVADTGIGIPVQEQERLFNEFFRATNARQVGGGTGLGLSIVKAIVERLGGEIEVDSKEGIGTKISVSLSAI